MASTLRSATKAGPSKKTSAAKIKKPAPAKARKPAGVTKKARPASKRQREKDPFTNIVEGSGDTFDITRPTTIGTTGCETCVGLYVPIGDDRCFVAHFNLEPQDNTEEHREQRLENYEVNNACYRAVVMLTKEFLNDAQWKGAWGKLTDGMRDELQMVCPKTRIRGKTYTGDAVVEAINEFFGTHDKRARKYANLLVEYSAQGRPRPIYPTDWILNRNWTAENSEANDNFAVANFFDDGRVTKGDEQEGPFPA